MKKNLAVLLVLPFLLSILSIFVVRLTVPLIENDITRIEWEYDDYEFYCLKQDKYRLNASGHTADERPPAEGNDLIWQVENVNKDEAAHAEIRQEGKDFYLIPLSEGEVYVTCRNEKGNVTRRMTGLIYLNNAIAVQTAVPSSQNSIDPTLYVGTHDIRDSKKTKAVIEFDIKAVPLSLTDGLSIAERSTNLSFERNGTTLSVTVNAAGESYFRLVATDGTERSFAFRAVEGVNVYTYDDLLYCTNRSVGGECMVLRKSFESLENAFRTDKNGNYDLSSPLAKNVACYGNYDVSTQRYSFEEEVFTVRTKGNSEYIRQWNAFASENTRYYEISDEIYVGLHVQKDVYGNGFTINFHNLTYPYDTAVRNVDGTKITVPALTPDNLFRGPLPYYAFGDPFTPLATVYGQDNVGMYVDGDGITISDLRLTGCNQVSSLSFLNTVGTVLEADGRNILIENCVLSLGKNVLRAFSSQVTVRNCLLSDALNFLLDTGANEYTKVNKEKIRTLLTTDGQTENRSLWDYLQSNTSGDALLENLIYGNGTWTKVKQAFLRLSDALNDATSSDGGYAGETLVEDCLFYRSGITSIGIESLFNGPYLLTGQAPSVITNLLRKYGISPCTVSEIGGISRPVKVTISGDTKFFDYKSEENFAVDGLIGESITSLAKNLGLIEDLSFNDLFPIVSLFSEYAKAGNYAYTADGKTLLNPIVTKYGGGLNRSAVSFPDESRYSTETKVDLVEKFASPANDADTAQNLIGMAKRLILTVIGGEPFGIYYCTDTALIGQSPSVDTLRSHI